jgi:hypothetical protein
MWNIKLVMLAAALSAATLSAQPPSGMAPQEAVAAVFAPGVISTSAHEGPFAFTPDGETIYFTRFAAGMLTPGFFVSQRQNGQWSPPKEVRFPEGASAEPFCFSPDGEKLFFTHLPDSTGHSRLWVAERDGEGWKNARPLGGVFEKWESDQTSPSVTSDGTLYFTSNRAGGSGGWDIYRSLLKDGQYIEPELLGGGRYSGISTTLNETGLTVAPSGEFMVFSTAQAPNGLGGADLYIADLRSSEGRQVWVENLGVAVNSSADETGPRLSPDGRRLYFCRSGDIYEIDLESARKSPPESSVWKRRADMPMPRDWPQLAVANGRIYVYGGYTGGIDLAQPRRWANELDVYDPAIDTWSTLPPAPSDWKQGTLVSVDDRLFLFRRGGPGLAEYHPESQKWEIKQDTASFVIGEAYPYQTRTVVLGRKAYTMFGSDEGFSYLVEYDFDSGIWTPKRSMPYPAPQLVSFDSHIYAFSGGSLGARNSVYDPATDQWSEVAPLDMPRFESATVAFANQLWLIGGHSVRTEGVAGNISPTVVRFDPARNEWLRGPVLPWQRAGVAAISVSGRLFVIGGIRLDKTVTYDKSVLEYMPADGAQVNLGPEVMHGGKRRGFRTTSEKP